MLVGFSQLNMTLGVTYSNMYTERSGWNTKDLYKWYEASYDIRECICLYSYGKDDVHFLLDFDMAILGEEDSGKSV